MISKDVLKKVRQIQIRSRHMVNDVFAGQYQSVFKGQGMEFHEVREYFPGDDIRSIDWNVTARMGHPFIKKFVEEREMTVMLMVDISASHSFGSTPQLKKNLAAELAAVLAFSAIRNNDRVGLILFTDEVEQYVPPQKGTRHVLRVIREVLHFEPQHKRTKLTPALDFLNHVTNRKSVTFLISDFFFGAEDYQRHLAITSKRHDLVGIIVGDKREHAWPRVGIIDWEDAETGERFMVDTSDVRTRNALMSTQNRKRQDLLKMLRGASVDPIEVYAGEPYEKELIKFFRMRERRLKV
ncbi:MAG: DUF58 domain-containing protein [Spartobacteria bacterium]|nr:DUF58 domain-containing protein [Spartobacteria bacterium]